MNGTMLFDCGGKCNGYRVPQKKNNNTTKIGVHTFPDISVPKLVVLS